MEIKGDVDKIFEEIEKSIEEGMQEIADKIEFRWKMKAMATLNTSKDEYIQGLKVTKQGDTFEVSLTGWLPNAVEFGQEPFDMKKHLLGNRLSRVIPLGKPVDRFRTVSKNSPEDSWWWKEIKHKGGVQINKEIEQEIKDELIPEVFNPLIEKIRAVGK